MAAAGEEEVWRWAPGTRVVLKGLNGAPELNGRLGSVLQALPENLAKGRVRVRVRGGSSDIEREVAVRPQALEAVAAEPAEDEDEEEDEEQEEDWGEDDEEDDEEEAEEAAPSRSLKPTGGAAVVQEQCGMVSLAPAVTSTTRQPPATQATPRWCYGCFKELAASEASRCSKCGVAIFCSRDCQRSCNPYHKLSCAPPDKERVATLPGGAVLRTLQHQFQGGGPKPETAQLLARMRELLVAAYAARGREKKKARQLLAADPDDVGMELHTIARVFLPSEAQCELYYRSFWAAPGMPEFLLSTELSTARKHVPGMYLGRDEFGRSPEDYDMLDDDDDSFGEGRAMAGYQFAFFHFNFLARTITMEGSSGANMCDVNSCKSPLRRSLPCFQAAARRLGILYLSSCRTCGDSLCSGPGAMLMLCSGEPSLRKDFLRAGLGRAVLHEMATAASKRTAVQLLASIPLSEWQDLPTEEAALLAGDLAETLVQRGGGNDEEDDDNDDEGGSVQLLRKVMNALFRRQTLDGVQPTSRSCEIMQAVLGLGPRCEPSTRAFFHFLLETGAGGHGPGDVFDAAVATRAWGKIENSNFHREGGAAKATYLRHMSAVMTKHERDEWDFLFEDEDVKRARMGEVFKAARITSTQ